MHFRQSHRTIYCLYRYRIILLSQENSIYIIFPFYLQLITAKLTMYILIFWCRTSLNIDLDKVIIRVRCREIGSLNQFCSVNWAKVTGEHTRIWMFGPVQIAMWFVAEQVAVESPELGRLRRTWSGSIVASRIHRLCFCLQSEWLLIGNGALLQNQFLKSLRNNHFQTSAMADLQAVIPQLTEKPDFVLKSVAKHKRGQNVSIKVSPLSQCPV